MREKMLILVTFLFFIIGSGCAAQSKCLHLSTHAQQLVTEYLRAESKDEAAKRIEILGRPGIAAVESALLVENDASRGNELCSLLGMIGGCESIPVLLEYFLRKTVLHDIDNVDPSEGRSIVLKGGAVSTVESQPEEALSKMLHRYEMDEKSDQFLQQLEVCFQVYDKHQEVRELIMEFLSDTGCDFTFGEKGSRALESIVLSAFFINPEEMLSGLAMSLSELLDCFATRRILESAANLAKRYHDSIYTSFLQINLPAKGPYAGIPAAEFGKWVEENWDSWWEKNKNRIRYNREESLFELVDE